MSTKKNKLIRYLHLLHFITMNYINSKYLLSFAFIIVLFLNACVHDKPKSEQVGQTPQAQLGAVAKPQYTEVNTWLDDFDNFKTAIDHEDVEKIKTYFNFPVAAETTQIWVAVYDNVDEDKRPQNFPDTFTEADLEKQHDKLFNSAFVKSLLKINSAHLYKTGEYTTPEIKEGGQSFHMLVQLDKASATLQLSVLYAGGTDENGEEISEGESATIYFFKVIDNKTLKFDKILFAG